MNVLTILDVSLCRVCMVLCVVMGNVYLQKIPNLENFLKYVSVSFCIWLLRDNII